MKHADRSQIEALLARVARLQAERSDAARRGHKAVINTANYNLLREVDTLAKTLDAVATENEALRAKLDTLTYAIEQCVEVQVCEWDGEGTPTEYTANLFGVEAAAPVSRPWFVAPAAVEAVERAVAAAREET